MSKHLLVNLDSYKSKEKFIYYLVFSWGFERKNIDKELEKYSGIIKKYSPEHATLMYELIGEHLVEMDDVHKQGYISSKKNNYLCLGDSSALKFFLTFLISVFSSALVSGINIEAIDKILVLGSVILMAMMVVLIKSSLKPKFYHEIISTVEKKLNKE